MQLRGNDMDNFDKDFSNVFDGIKKTMNAIDGELDLLKQINAEQKEELRKAKRIQHFYVDNRYNIISSYYCWLDS